jgi:hypothetical protein
VTKCGNAQLARFNPFLTAESSQDGVLLFMTIWEKFALRFAESGHAQLTTALAKATVPDIAMLANFSALFWGWADYTPKNWSNAPYKRGYAPPQRLVDLAPKIRI